MTSILMLLAQAALPPFVMTQAIQPRAVFIKEDTPLIVHAQIPESLENPDNRYAVLRVDATGKVLRWEGFLTDIGRVGDLKKNDGILSRKVHAYQKKGGILYFVIVKDTAESPSDQVKEVDPKLAMRVSVVARPTFLQAVKRAFSNLGN